MLILLSWRHVQRPTEAPSQTPTPLHMKAKARPLGQSTPPRPAPRAWRSSRRSLLVEPLQGTAFFLVSKFCFPHGRFQYADGLVIDLRRYREWMPVLSAVQSPHCFAGLAGIPRCPSGEHGSGSHCQPCISVKKGLRKFSSPPRFYKKRARPCA
jgi:hypothetical protein